MGQFFADFPAFKRFYRAAARVFTHHGEGADSRHHGEGADSRHHGEGADSRRRGAARDSAHGAIKVLTGIVIAFVLINAGVAVAIAASSKHEASAWPGASFTFWPERTWQQIERRIKGLPASPRMQVREIGVVRYKQGSFPITVLRFPAAQTVPRPLRVLLVSGVHGTETAGVEALLRTAESLARYPTRHASVSIDVVPVVNPWGWVYGYRYDGDGEDVNRDFASRRTQEARIVRSLMDESAPYDLFLDLHESKHEGYFIYQYLPADKGMGAEYVRVLKALGRPREDNYQEGMFQTRDGVLQIPAAALFWISLGGRLSLEQFARMRGTPNSYTVESSLSDAFENRVIVHQNTVEAFIESLPRALRRR